MHLILKINYVLPRCSTKNGEIYLLNVEADQ